MGEVGHVGEPVIASLVRGALAAVALTTTLSAHAVEVEHEALFDETIENLPNRQEVLDALAAMVEIRGWRCDSISSARTLLLSRGFKISCNRFDYTYLIRDRGGNWIVSLK